MANEKRTERAGDLLEAAMYLLAAVCFVYFLVKGMRPKVFEAALIIVVLMLIRGVVHFTKTELFPALRLSILLFIFLTMFLANEFGFYGVIPYLDKIEHLLSGVILCFVGLLIYRQIHKREDTRRLHARTAVWFSLFFSAAMAGVWEVYEFTTDRLLGFNSQNGSLLDTMTDIICGMIGAVATSLYLAYKAGRKQMPLIDVRSSPQPKG